MSKCIKCNIEVLDQTTKCPLCSRVLELNGTEHSIYPDAIRTTKRFRTLFNVIFFLSIVIALACVLVNTTFRRDILWSGIPVLILVYANISLHLLLTGKSNYVFNVVFTPLFFIALLIGIDFFSGNYGWALNYVFPICITATDLVILILMMIRRRFWQHYLMAQIFMILLSLVYGLLLLIKLTHSIPLFWLALGSSCLLLLGTVIIGDYKARSELDRRFHA